VTLGPSRREPIKSWSGLLPETYGSRARLPLIARFPSLPGHLRSRDDGVERRSLACGRVVIGIKRPGPHLSKLIGRSPILIPDAVRVGTDKLDVAIVGKGVVESHHIAYKDALELYRVGAALWFAVVIMQNTAGIRQTVNGSQGDVLRCLRQ